MSHAAGVPPYAPVYVRQEVRVTGVHPHDWHPVQTQASSKLHCMARVVHADWNGGITGEILVTNGNAGDREQWKGRGPRVGCQER